MATRLYAIDPGDQNIDVIEGVGSAASSKSINLTIDIANTVVTEGGSTRTVKLQEVIEALDNMKAYILRQNNWPPA